MIATSAFGLSISYRIKGIYEQIQYALLQLHAISDYSFDVRRDFDLYRYLPKRGLAGYQFHLCLVKT